ncbi:hypothetical protein DFH09DRAFT_1097754 [Mycena vulgaris]|nr:hypothetical protein DFH09DRAFT_1097754 [Mycena vulgaris]
MFAARHRGSVDSTREHEIPPLPALRPSFKLALNVAGTRGGVLASTRPGPLLGALELRHACLLTLRGLLLLLVLVQCIGIRMIRKRRMRIGIRTRIRIRIRPSMNAPRSDYIQINLNVNVTLRWKFRPRLFRFELGAPRGRHLFGSASAYKPCQTIHAHARGDQVKFERYSGSLGRPTSRRPPTSSSRRPPVQSQAVATARRHPAGSSRSVAAAPTSALGAGRSGAIGSKQIRARVHSRERWSCCIRDGGIGALMQ